MSQKYIAIPKLFFASLISVGSFGNVLCPDVSQDFEFKLPNRNIPRRTTPGGSRSDGQCLANNGKPTLTPLTPSNSFGFTLAKYPTIFVHIPRTSATKAFFSVRDLNGNFHYQSVISLPERSGAIGISLVNAASPLKLDTNYQWSLALICGAQLEPDDPQVVGLIQRVKVNPTLAHLLKSSDVSQESVCLLSQQGIWYDLIYHLANLRKAQPENSFLTQHWEKLLTTVGLKAIATEPLFH